MPGLANEVGPPADRRGSCRYSTRGARIVIGWVVQEPSSTSGPHRRVASGSRPQSPQPGQFVQLEAALIDISQTGLCLNVPCLPPGNRGLWVGLKGSNPTDWSSVVLRSLAEPQPGEFVLRLSFTDDCPYDLFKYAVLQTHAERTPG